MASDLTLTSDPNNDILLCTPFRDPGTVIILNESSVVSAGYQEIKPILAQDGTFDYAVIMGMNIASKFVARGIIGFLGNQSQSTVQTM